MKPVIKKRTSVFFNVQILVDDTWHEFATDNLTRAGAEEIIRYQRGADNPSKFSRTATFRIVRRTVIDEFGEGIAP
jgi:hypothetical protein